MMISQIQLWNRKDLMIPNGSIKYFSRIDKSDEIIRIIIYPTLLKFQLWNNEHLMLPKIIIKVSSIRDKSYGSIRISI